MHMDMEKGKIQTTKMQHGKFKGLVGYVQICKFVLFFYTTH